MKVDTTPDRPEIHVIRTQRRWVGIFTEANGKRRSLRLTPDEAIGVADALVDVVERMAAQAPSDGGKVAQISAGKAGIASGS